VPSKLPPGPAEKPPPDPKDTPEDPAVAPLVKRLKGGNAADRILAANELAKLGLAARSAARDICAAATDDSKEVRQSALEALEKVRPDLAKSVTALLVDRQSSLGAALHIERLGVSASPAIPALIWNSKWGYGAGPANIMALAKVGPTDPEAVRAIIRHAERPAEETLRGAFVPIGMRVVGKKEAALEALGTLTENRGSLRQEIVACLVKVLGECEAGLGDRVIGVYNSYAKTTMESAARYGPDAKEAIPLMKKLKLNPNREVREAAASALEKIDK
jgi:hypothetical protein